ncbi:MAG: hypothetical protein R3B65_00085 [Candidatus Paceibacterota bacterium]
MSVNFVLAAGAMIPFGGRIAQAPIPGAACPSSVVFEPTSPFAIVPVMGIPGPFSAIPGPTGFGQVVPSAWILGLYLPTPIPDCTVAVPPVGAAPVFKATIFGTSVPLPL